MPRKAAAGFLLFVMAMYIVYRCPAPGHPRCLRCFVLVCNFLCAPVVLHGLQHGLITYFHSAVLTDSLKYWTPASGMAALPSH